MQIDKQDILRKILLYLKNLMRHIQSMGRVANPVNVELIPCTDFYQPLTLDELGYLFMKADLLPPKH